MGHCCYLFHFNQIRVYQPFEWSALCQIMGHLTLLSRDTSHCSAGKFSLLQSSITSFRHTFTSLCGYFKELVGVKNLPTRLRYQMLLTLPQMFSDIHHRTPRRHHIQRWAHCQLSQNMTCKFCVAVCPGDQLLYFSQSSCVFFSGIVLASCSDSPQNVWKASK